ncbi:SDR family NAD(P)-dependent oxidoreductase [Streptomyces sp. NPDC056501]|uniref:SDR family NAD(P)-dependent oxidoreductase n=1 Tax=Streptomyces sp. NPDC056501 TaxID=3345841 RepID=UPI0036AB439B
MTTTQPTAATPPPSDTAHRPTALVTGASAGIGRAFAHRLAASGHRVIAVARNEERLQALMDELGPGHDYLAADLGDPDGLHKAARLLADRRVHLLVNNVGTATTGPFATTPLTHAHGMLRLNCEALVTLSHAFLAQARPGDTLLNVSSTLAHTPLPNLAVYSATKAFVTAFSEALWSEHRASGIHVLALCPGMTATESQSHDDAPAALVQTPEQVVATALRALRRRSRSRPTVVPGTANRLLLAAARTLPRHRTLTALART